jgi:hypothetical protein
MLATMHLRRVELTRGGRAFSHERIVGCGVDRCGQVITEPTPHVKAP